MSTMQQTEESIRAPRSPRIAWGLLGGGVFFFVGGSMHPGEDPPGLSLKEHLHLLFQDPAWYPSHALLLAGMVLIAASLVTLVRCGTLASVPRAQKVGAIAAVAAVLGSLDMLLHLVVASEASSIATGEGTPLTDVHVVAETLTVPVFGFSIAALGVIGALTRTMGNRLTAVLAVIGGVTYGLAGATFAFTDALNFLFPGGGAVGLWAIAVGIWLLLQSRATSLADPAT